MPSVHEDVDWETVRYFLHAARAKSLSGAARSLGVEHTTVGRRLSSLEQALGAALVERGPAGLTPTPLGQRVYALALEMERAASSIAVQAISERRNVRLVVPSGFTTLLLPRLEELRQQQPGIALEVVSGARRVDLRKGEADLALRVGPVEDPVLVSRRVAEVGSALYASKAYLSRAKHPVDLDDLSGHSVIGFHRSLTAMPAAEWLRARSSGATIVLRSREATDMLAAAQSGAGLAVLPCFLGDADASLVRLTPRPVASRGVSLVYRPEARVSAEVRSVIAFLVAVMREHALTLRGRA